MAAPEFCCHSRDLQIIELIATEPGHAKGGGGPELLSHRDGLQTRKETRVGKPEFGPARFP